MPSKTLTATEMPVWQTKSVSAQKPGSGRHYAMKQVDAFVPTDTQQVKASFKPTTSVSANTSSFEAIRNGSDRVPQSFLPTIEVASSKAFIPFNAQQLQASQSVMGVSATAPLYVAVAKYLARAPPSIVPTFETEASADFNTASFTYDSAPSGRLITDSSTRTNVSNASNTVVFKERRKNASAALTGGHQPASTSRPKIAKRSAIRKVTDADVTQGTSPIVVFQCTQVRLTCW